MGRLDGKVALITGGARGIGRASAALFAREGARVVVADRDEAAGREAVAAIERDAGPDVARFVAADVGRAEDCAAAVAAAVAAFGGLQVVFANAAVGTIVVGGTVETIEPERWELAYRTNLAGVYATVRAALPHLRAAGGGAIVVTSSSSALVGTRARPTHAYAAMKGALISLVRAMAVSYGPEGIRANAVIPGLIRTRLTADLLDTPEGAARAIAGIPLGHAGEPEDIAYAALYLASDEARFVTGTTLVVDGGATVA
ncbi:MAG TPA: glucose 1-dehydrogenase [Thermomicrobiales bacterium]|nr:glucose 1-dehydrogenase [Thermomicrobiales bacterium]